MVLVIASKKEKMILLQFYLFLIIIRQVFMETVYGVYYNKNIKFSTCYNQYDGQGSGRQE